MRRALIPLLVLIFSIAVEAKNKKEQPPSAADLAAITNRGLNLFEYDVASWHATDVVQDLKPEKGSTRYYIAKKTNSNWEVVFGRLSEAHDKFLVVYKADQGTRPDFFTAKRLDPPHEDIGFYLAAAKAFDAALRDLGAVNRPYNDYAIPSESGQLYVYLLPAQTKDGVYPLGGDVRYTFSSDGNTMLEKRQMHKAILEIALPKEGKSEAGVHTHVLSSIPEDSDVFHVLTRRPSIPEYIGTMDKKIWVINTDGTIVPGK